MSVIDAHCHLLQGGTDRLLREMDNYGITKSWICPDRKFIAVYNRQGNEYIAQAVRSHPDRFMGFASASPWLEQEQIHSVLKEARDMGLGGLKINTKIQGMTLLDDPIFFMVQIAEKFNWPVYCHTGTPVTAMPLQLAELAERFASVNFIMGHGGFSDFWYDVPDVMQRCSNVFLETSYMPPTQILNNIKLNGSERVIFGSDRPYSDPGFELKKNSLLKIDKNRREAILSTNAQTMITPKEESVL